MRTTFVIVLFAATVVAEDKVQLTPKWKANESVSVKTVDVTSLFENGREMVLRTRKIEYVQVTTAVKKGRAVGAKRKFNVHEFKTPYDDVGEKHELAGQELTFVSREGLLHNDKAPALMTMGAGGDWTWMLPTKAVAVGDTWTVKKNINLMAIATAFMGTDTKCRLASIDGDKAVIEFTQPDQLKGSAEFSRKAGRVTKASFVFTLKSRESTSKHSFTYSLSIVPKKK